MGDDPKKRKKGWRILFIVGGIISLIFCIAIICLANIRSSALFDLLDTYPGRRHLYLGHDMSTGFAAFTLAVSILVIIHAILWMQKCRRLQALIIFCWWISAVLLSASSLTTFWSTNTGTHRDEYRWTENYNDLIWEHSTAYDWMSQSYYYSYGDAWKNLQKEENCCGVRGPKEIGSVRSLWNNQTDIFSTFEFPYECCTLDMDKDSSKLECLDSENLHQTGCYKKVVHKEFVNVAAVTFTQAIISIVIAVYTSYYYIYHHAPLYKMCWKLRC